MTDEEKAEEYYYKAYPTTLSIGEEKRKKKVMDIFLAGLKTGKETEKEYVKNNAFTSMKESCGKWHKIFEGEPYPTEYWDLPQDNLPKIMNFYFVKLKNGFIKICELKYDHWSRKLCFYDLHGGKQSNVAEWLDYPTTRGDKND